MIFKRKSRAYINILGWDDGFVCEFDTKLWNFAFSLKTKSNKSLSG